MSNIYALAFCPPPEIVEPVRQCKHFLKRRIGWYHSVNSVAHITVVSFTANSWQLAAVSRFAAAFCAKRASFAVRFNHFSTYPNGTFFLAPDEPSRSMLRPVMEDFNRKMPVHAVRSTDPHLTIARGLDMGSLYYARTLFAKATSGLSFPVDGLSLRRLDEARGQYDIVGYFPFGSAGLLPYDCAGQGCLF